MSLPPRGHDPLNENVQKEIAYSFKTAALAMGHEPIGIMSRNLEIYISTIAIRILVYGLCGIHHHASAIEYQFKSTKQQSYHQVKFESKVSSIPVKWRLNCYQAISSSDFTSGSELVSVGASSTGASLAGADSVGSAAGASSAVGVVVSPPPIAASSAILASHSS